MHKNELIPHLFRTEYSKITAVLCNFFGLDHIEEAEDIASETFLAAMETWPYKGIPANPTAWLYVAARNKALNHIARNQTFRAKISDRLASPTLDAPVLEIDLTTDAIADSQLRMMFAICHPAIPVESQIGLALRILCGFGIDEIANAFLTSTETINKRLYRAREKLRAASTRLEFPPPPEIQKRLDTVLTTLYLLFNEGYYSESDDSVLREDLCLEAMRLTYLLVESPLTRRPVVHALLALMCFHASRFPARRNDEGDMILYSDQDDSLWNRDLIARGVEFLHLASEDKRPSRYHFEAGIAYWHTIKADSPEKWESILQLYNNLLTLEYSPVAALNRTYALSRVKGKEHAIAEAEKLKLTTNHYYFTLLGELYTGVDDRKAVEHLRRARSLARTEGDKKTIDRRLSLFDGH